MSEPVWILRKALEELHDATIARHGGIHGLRDSGMLDSALARPKNLFAYEAVEDPFPLAATYAFGIAKNHPFADGNKRSALLAAALFLSLNGFRLGAGSDETVRSLYDFAASKISEDEFAAWLRAKSKPTPA
jgi:death-on-curing protein